MIYDLVASAWFEAMIGRAPRILLDTLRDDDGSHINAVCVLQTAIFSHLRHVRRAKR
jgi:hypothetical protein